MADQDAPIVVFDALKLTTPGTGGNVGPEPVYSRALPMAGRNAVSATLTIIELEENDGVNAWLQGSSDLQNWLDIGTLVSGSAVGSTQGQRTSIATAFIRVGVIETSATEAEAMIALTIEKHIL